MANKTKRDSSWKNVENYSKRKERLKNAVLQHPDEAGDNSSVYNFMKNSVNNKRKDFHILPFKQYEKMGLNEQEALGLPVGMITDSPGQTFQTPGSLPQDNMDTLSLVGPSGTGKKPSKKKKKEKTNTQLCPIMTYKKFLKSKN